MYGGSRAISDTKEWHAVVSTEEWSAAMPQVVGKRYMAMDMTDWTPALSLETQC